MKEDKLKQYIKKLIWRIYVDMSLYEILTEKEIGKYAEELYANIIKKQS